MRTAPVSLCPVAVVAEYLQVVRVVVLLDPDVEVTCLHRLSVCVAAAVNVIKGQKYWLGLAAAGAASAVVLENFQLQALPLSGVSDALILASSLILSLALSAFALSAVTESPISVTVGAGVEGFQWKFATALGADLHQARLPS
jgi:hypothetical protein